MGKKGLIKILLNLLIILINVFVFSKAFLGIQISLKNVMEAIIGISTILFSAVFFIYVNTNIAKVKRVQKVMRPGSTETSTLDDCYNELKKYNKNSSSSFDKPLADITKQIERFSKKKLAIGGILSEKFDVNEITYDKYSGAVESIAKLFQENVENAIAKIKSFDGADMEASQKEIFQEYNKYILKVTVDNEEIILKLDRLIFEISKLKDKTRDGAESMDVIKEIEQLIQNTKLYK